MVYMAPQAKAKILATIFLGLGAVIILALPAFASAATLRLSPATGTHYVGHSFTVEVDVDSTDQAMNAAEGTIIFPSNLMHVISVSTVGSIMNLWVEQPSFSNKDGQVNFQGVVVNPGFQGTGANIITITFQAIAPGTGAIKFSSGSVLANDGNGTEIVDNMSGASVTLLPASATPAPALLAPPVITSDPAVSSGTWYNINQIAFNWDIPDTANSVDYVITDNPNYQLPDVGKGLSTGTTYSLVGDSDGPWYFFVNYESGGDWSAAAMAPVLIDRTPPESFVIVREDTNLLDPQPVFEWAATDKTSGIAGYQVKIGDGDWFNAASIADASTSEYILPPQAPTDSNTLTVRAYDAAGNYRDASITFRVLAPTPSCDTTKIIINCVITDFLRSWAWMLFIIGFLLAILAFVSFWRLFYWKRTMQRDMRDFQHRVDHDLHAFEQSYGSKDENELKQSTQHLEEDVEHGVRDLED